MNEKELSRRLEIVASYLPNGAKFADIGSDHAYLPCYVCLKDPTASAIAGELNEGPYQSAKREVESNQLKDRVSVRKGNGLAVVQPGEVEQVVIAGMGGTLITSILEEGKEKLAGVRRIIVQPNVDAKSLRRWFSNNGFQIIAEDIMEESGHIYEVIAADKADEKYDLLYSEKEIFFGPFLLEEKSPVFKEKWAEEKAKKEYVKTEIQKAINPNQEKISNLNREINWIEEVLADD